MDWNLQQIVDRICGASRPEDVFGPIPDPDPFPALTAVFRRLARISHPDMYQTLTEKDLAHTAFAKLNDWLKLAQDKLAAGTYGRTDEFIVRTGLHEYSVEGSVTHDGLFAVYPCRFMDSGRSRRAVLRVVRDPRDNDLAENEVRALHALAQAEAAAKYAPYLPKLIDAFIYDDGMTRHHATVVERYEGWYSLEQVRADYPEGLDPRDMAWIWRRLLVVVGFAHANAVIHGEISPADVWIQPEAHGLMLRNWFHSSYADANTGISLEDFGTPEPRSFGADIRMSAECMLHLLGGDRRIRTLPGRVPAPIQSFLSGCALRGSRAPQDAWALKEEFDELLDRLWGERTFHPFAMKSAH